MRTFPLRLGAWLLLLLCAAPARAGGDATDGELSGLEARLELRREDGLRAETFASDESVVLVLALRNPTQAPLRLALPTAQTHDFAISNDDGRQVWRWSEGRGFAQMLSELVLAPGEEQRFRETCRPDSPLAAGRYRAEAWVGAGHRGPSAAAVDFRIE